MVCDSLWPHCLLVTFSHSKDRCGSTSESLWKPGIHVWETSFIIGMAELQLCLRQKVNSVSLGVVKGNLWAQKERGAARKSAGRGWHLGLHRTSLQSNWRKFFFPQVRSLCKGCCCPSHQWNCREIEITSYRNRSAFWQDLNLQLFIKMQLVACQALWSCSEC